MERSIAVLRGLGQCNAGQTNPLDHCPACGWAFFLGVWLEMFFFFASGGG
jgi:hypothetical protein